MLYLAALWGLSAGVYVVAPDLRYFGDIWKFRWIQREMTQDRGIPTIFTPPSNGADYDYVFSGSSHIWNNIDAAMAGREIGGSERSVVSLGSYLYGRDLHAMIALDFLRRNRVRNLVIECWDKEYDRVHNHYSHLCTPVDVFQHARYQSLFASDGWNFQGDFKQPLSFSFECFAMIGVRGYTLPIALGTNSHWDQRERMEIYDQYRGSWPMEDVQASAAFLRDNTIFTDPPVPVEDDQYGDSPQRDRTVWHHELSRLTDYCHQHGVRVIFVFAPSRENAVPSEAYLDYLRSLGGEIISFPRHLMIDPAYWRDRGHLNKEGCRLMTEYFIERERTAR